MQVPVVTVIQFLQQLQDFISAPQVNRRSFTNMDLSTSQKAPDAKQFNDARARFVNSAPVQGLLDDKTMPDCIRTIFGEADSELPATDPTDDKCAVSSSKDPLHADGIPLEDALRACLDEKSSSPRADGNTESDPATDNSAHVQLQRLLGVVKCVDAVMGDVEKGLSGGDLAIRDCQIEKKCLSESDKKKAYKGARSYLAKCLNTYQDFSNQLKTYASAFADSVPTTETRVSTGASSTTASTKEALTTLTTETVQQTPLAKLGSFSGSGYLLPTSSFGTTAVFPTLAPQPEPGAVSRASSLEYPFSTLFTFIAAVSILMVVC